MLAEYAIHSARGACMTLLVDAETVMASEATADLEAIARDFR